MFATSPLLWSQAVITEVYALNVMLAAALLVIAAGLAVRPSSAQSARSDAALLALYGFLLGVGLGNHLPLLAVGVPLLLWLWRSLGWRPLVSLWLIAPFVVGVAVYLYLPIRAGQDPPINWGNTDTVRGAAWMLTARPYQEYVFGISAGTVVSRLADWTELVFSQFNPLGLFFGLISIPALRRRAPMFLLPSLAGIGIINVYSITYKPESPISSCLDPSNAPSSTRAIVVSLTDAVNHPIKLTKPSLGVVS